MSTKPMKDANPGAFLLRSSALMHTQQYMREIYQNSVEAGATDIRFTFCQDLFKLCKIKRSVIIDNGPGMSKKDLEKYTNETNSSSKSTGGIDENFGVGLKVSTLPFHQYGVVVISKTKDNPYGSMIWLHMDKGIAGARGLTSYENAIAANDPEEGIEPIIDYVIDFEEIINRGYDKYTIDGVDWLNWWGNNTKFKHGTAVILCGNQSGNWQDTFQDMTDKGIKYLNERYLEFTISCKFSRLHKKSNNQYCSEILESPLRVLKKHSTELKCLSFKGWKIRTFIKKSHINKARITASIASIGFCQSIIYKNEVYGDFYQLSPQAKASTRNSWGIYYKNVGKKLTLLIEPPIYTKSSKCGIFPNQERSKLSWKESPTAEQTEHLPLDELKKYYQENMPGELVELIEEEAYNSLFKEHKSKAAKKMERWLKIPKDERKAKKGTGLLISDIHGSLMAGERVGDLFGLLNNGPKNTKPSPPSQQPTEPKPPKPPKTKEELEQIEKRKKARQAAEQARREAPRVRFISKKHDDHKERFLIDGIYQGAFYEPPSAKGNHGNVLWINSDHNLLHGYVNVAEEWLTKKDKTFKRKFILEHFVKPFWEEYAPLPIQHGKSLPEFKKDAQAFSAERLTWALLGCQAFFEMDMPRLYKNYKLIEVIA